MSYVTVALKPDVVQGVVDAIRIGIVKTDAVCPRFLRLKMAVRNQDYAESARLFNEYDTVVRENIWSVLNRMYDIEVAALVTSNEIERIHDSF